MDLEEKDELNEVFFFFIFLLIWEVRKGGKEREKRV